MAEPLEQQVQQLVDGHVIKACQRGDREAFRLLFEAYKDRVFTIAVYSLRDETLAGDVTQQIFLKLMTRINQFRGDSEFTTWLYRLVINSCHDERRKHWRFLPLGSDNALGRADQRRSQETRYEQKEIADSVKEAIGTLKPKMRLPILLKYIEGLSYEEIASVLECSPGTIASRLNRAHKMLANKLRHLKNEI